MSQFQLKKKHSLSIGQSPDNSLLFPSTTNTMSPRTPKVALFKTFSSQASPTSSSMKTPKKIYKPNPKLTKARIEKLEKLRNSKYSDSCGKGANLTKYNSYSTLSPVRYSSGTGEGCFVEKIHLNKEKVEQALSKFKNTITEPSSPSGSPKFTKEDFYRTHDLGEMSPGRKEKCVCNECTCGNHHCATRLVRLQYPKLKTHYQESFTPTHLPPQKTEVFNHDKQNKNLFPKDQIDLKSTYNLDFKTHQVHSPQRFQERPTTTSMPFLANSSYEKDFPNWGFRPTHKIESAKLHNHGVPFRGESSYAVNFSSPVVIHPTISAKPDKRSNSDYPFMAQTTNMHNFQPYVVKGNVQLKKRVYECIPTHSFKGMFKTTAQQDFTTKKIIPPCKMEGLPPPPPLNSKILYFNPLKEEYYSAK